MDLDKKEGETEDVSQALDSAIVYRLTGHPTNDELMNKIGSRVRDWKCLYKEFSGKMGLFTEDEVSRESDLVSTSKPGLPGRTMLSNASMSAPYGAIALAVQYTSGL